MRIIAFGDIHMAAGSCRNIPRIGEADLIVITGDITNYGGKLDAREVLNQIMTYNPNVLAQFGNLDAPEVNDYLENLGLNLHGQARLVHGRLCFIGVGGSNPTPFHTPSEFSEDQLSEIINRAHLQAAEFISLAEPLNNCRIPTILVSHPPPAQTKVDRLLNGRHVGSTAIRRFIEKTGPDICICGHIHEGKGEDRIGATHILNPGMLKQGSWVEILFENSTLQARVQ
jgi:uncharacterized protein